jgi:hypothetical protein
MFKVCYFFSSCTRHCCWILWILNCFLKNVKTCTAHARSWAAYFGRNSNRNELSWKKTESNCSQLFSLYLERLHSSLLPLSSSSSPYLSLAFYIWCLFSYYLYFAPVYAKASRRLIFEDICCKGFTWDNVWSHLLQELHFDSFSMPSAARASHGLIFETICCKGITWAHFRNHLLQRHHLGTFSKPSAANDLLTVDSCLKSSDVLVFSLWKFPTIYTYLLKYFSVWYLFVYHTFLSHHDLLVSTLFN